MLFKLFLPFSILCGLNGINLKLKIVTTKSNLIKNEKGAKLQEQFGLDIGYEHKVTKLPDNNYMDPREFVKLPTIEKVPSDLVFEIDLGPEAELAVYVQLKILWTSIELGMKLKTLSRVVKLKIYKPDYGKIYHLNLGQAGYSKINFSGQLSLDKPIREDEAIVAFVDVPLMSESANETSQKIDKFCSLFSLGCKTFIKNGTKLDKNRNGHTFHLDRIKNWMLCYGETCPKCNLELVATKVINIEPCFSKVNLTFNPYSLITQIADQKENGYNSFVKKQAQLTIKRIDEEQRKLKNEIQNRSFQLKINKEIFANFSNEKIVNAIKIVQQILEEEPPKEITDLEENGKKLLECLNFYFDVPDFYARQALETIRIVQEKSEP
ncbi:hypothetical protein niasHT_012124 [Heterodera trifolii]|uniref:Uncharacterized protein n=1 Tax=Heterodera trifolii TaxID=157864 RepID=A0ABD2LA91_9BILA